MKSDHNVLKAIAAAVLVLSSGFAAAGGDNTVTVTAAVSSVCKFDSTTSTASFGTIDPSLGTGAKTAPISVPYKCTNKLTPSVTLPTGPYVLKNAANDEMEFTVGAITAPAGKGFSTSVNATATASIAEAIWKDAAAGSYTGTVILSINN